VPTAVAVLQLHDQGLLDLDDPVSNHLDFFQATLDGRPAPPISIRQLLRHTSGLPDPVPAIIGWVHHEEAILNQTQLVRQHLPAYSELKFAPDTDTAYSNMGYMVLGAVVEAVTGQDYESYVREKVLDPLGMQQTGFLYSEIPGAAAAAGSHTLASMYSPILPFLLDLDELVRERRGARWWFNPVYLDVTPSSGLIGSASDAALLAAALLQPGSLLSPESQALLLPQGPSPTKRPLGWAEYNLTGRPWVQHQGGGPGFAALMRLYPEENLGIILMANSTHLPSNQLAEAFASLPWPVNR
jgi:CubicO group peptidase (beta-lactamase class C family)